MYVDIKAEPPGFKGTEGPVELTVTAPDPDDVSTNWTITTTLPPLAPNQVHTILTYTRLAGSSPEVTATLRVPNGGPYIGLPFKKSASGVEPGQFLYLTLGARLPGMRETLRKANESGGNATSEAAVYLDKVADLPAHWFAYEGVDTIILCTSNRNGFLLPFANPNAPRYRQALVEWVERGGNLVICAGRNQNDVAQVAELQRLLPVNLTGTKQLTEVSAGKAGEEGGPFTLGVRKQLGLDIAQMAKKEGRSFRTLLTEEKTNQPLIVQASFGLGRVTVAAFDPDQKPVADWNEQKGFWEALLKQAGPRLPKPENENNVNQYNYGYYTSPQELLNQLQLYLENFDDVPVIPFGWVALFIVVYIIIVGPLDYLFLKKVVKRLELTWITFPTVVLVVSALAYFTAYQLKGKDLRIRKVDVIDVDLRGKQSIGHTWFTLFSPRIQHYTIGVEASAPDWTPKPADDAAWSVAVVSWMNRPDIDRRGPRTRRQSLFRRSYDYEADGLGLRGVPIQVWSTKSFTATWQAPLPTEQSLVVADLRRSQDETLGVTGTLTWRPDAKGPELKDVHLFWRNKVYKFDLEPGKPRKVDDLVQMARTGDDLKNWLPAQQPGTPDYSYSYRGYRPTVPNLDDTLRLALFNQAQQASLQRNASLRFLDQTWRVQHDEREELVLLAHLAPHKGDAETVSQDAVSPSRLWLGSLPTDDKPQRLPLVGLMLQETYVRVFIPVQP